jgi:hypothetical protein
MRPIEKAVLNDNIEEVEYWMDQEPFHPDRLMKLAQSDYMVAFLIKHGADDPCECQEYVLDEEAFINFEEEEEDMNSPYASSNDHDASIWSLLSLCIRPCRM